MNEFFRTDIIVIMKRFLMLVILIGFLFNTFHEFVFYSIDPCMSKVETVIKFDSGDDKDPLCEIHNELHQVYLSSFKSFIPKSKFEETYSFNYKKPFLKPFSTEIFKPPKHLA